ncbi:MAG TPA: glycosyltransferase family 2 protein [Thermoanaerobaculia bacterium]|nr:glycosyltransferase family 2 protein [Thermoanaerobaculia bacterium]
MRLGVVIVNHDRRQLLVECLASLAAASAAGEPLVVVVDNGSRDDSAAAARAAAPAAEVLVLPHNTGFAHANNVGIRRALERGCDGVLVLNNDTRVAPGALDALAGALDAERRIGMVAARVVMADDRRTLDGTGQRVTVDGFGKLEDSGRDRDAAGEAKETFCPYGAAAFFGRDLLLDVAADGEWFDEDFRLYCEELDLGWRARLRGWRCVYAPAAVVYHHRGGTAGQYSELLAYYTCRNTIYNILKNYPGWYAPRALLLSLLRPAVLALGLLLGRGPASKFGARLPARRLAAILLRGWRDAARSAPRMWRKRRRIQARRTAANEEVARWFRELGEPFFRGLLR